MPYQRNGNIYKAFAITVYIRGKGTSTKSVAVKKVEPHTMTVTEEVASDKK